MRPSDVLKRYGWTQATLRDDYGRVCALGAYEEALTDPEMRTDRIEDWAYEFMVKAAELYPDDLVVRQCRRQRYQQRMPCLWTGWVAAFNDDEDRTMVEVLTVLEKMETDW